VPEILGGDPKAPTKDPARQKKRRAKSRRLHPTLEIGRSVIPLVRRSKARLATVPATIARDCAEFYWPVHGGRFLAPPRLPVNFLDFQKPDALED
jgi:hypothetical protein